MSSSIGAWGIFRDGPGKYAWIVIAGIASLISVIKPFLQWPKEIERYGQLSLGHTALYLDIKRLVEHIAVDQEVRDTTVKEYDGAILRYKELALKDDPKPIERKVQEFEVRVNEQIRIKDLWRPSKNEKQ
jgi:c-di-GMP-related signal transduction protein